MVDKDIEDEEAELKKTLEELRTKPSDTTPVAEHNRQVEARADSDVFRKNLENKLLGAAGGLGLRSPAGAGAPAPRRLVDSAARLHQIADDVWELHYSDSALSYVDAAGVVGRVRYWAELATLAAVEKHQVDARSSLLVSGLVKTGKSYTLEHVVPAVVAEELRKQGEKGPLAGMVVLRLRGDELYRQEGATVMLRSLLNELLRWAREKHVPMREDEVQSLFLPTIGGELDAGGTAYIRDSFIKQLLVHGPRTMLWCLTGSSMALTWISLADVRPSAVDLPATHSTENMSLAWKQLQGRFPHVPLDPKLLELCPPSIALLTGMVRSWIITGQPRDVVAFVRKYMRATLFDQSHHEWKRALEGMPPSQRIAVMDLSSPGMGARIDTDLHSGLRRFLEPHLDRKEDGRSYLRDSHHRQIVRVLFNKDGTLRGRWAVPVSSASVTQLDAGWNLFHLGQAADYLLGPHASRRWEHGEPPVEMDEFKARMQAITDNVANKLEGKEGGVASGPQELWEREPWFQRVLQSKWNDRDHDVYKEDKGARCTHLDMLVLYLRLSRNVLAHTKPWGREVGDMVDVGVMEALPGVLEQSLSAFNEDMVGALRVLSRRTVEEAAAEFGAQLSGGGGGGGGSEGLAEDEGSRRSGRSGGTSGGSRYGRRGSSRGGGRSGRSVRAMADKRASAYPGPAAGCGQCTPLVYVTGRPGVWSQGGPRAAMLAPRLRVQRSLLTPSTAVGLRLPW